MKKYYIILIAFFMVKIAFAQQLFDNLNNNNIQNKAMSQDNKNAIDEEMSKRLESSLLQIPDDVNGRLYRLCKIWGYFKYFHQDKCTLKWDTLLNTTIKQVLLSTNNVDFNNDLMDMFNKVGNNTYIATPGLQPDTNLNVNNAWITDTVLSQDVRNFLDTFTINIHPDTSTCFIKYNDYTTGYSGLIDFSKDLVTMPINYIIEADRLTVMFYYWNIINYFSPYRNIMDQSWDSTLYQFIPQIRQASTVNNFHKTFLKMTTKINDSHGYTNSNIITTNFWGGSFLPPIYCTRIDTNCVVTKLQNITSVHIGDILTSVKGIGIHDIEDSLSNYTPASTPATLYRDIYYQMMLGTYNSSIICTFLDSTNNTYSVTLTRTMSLGNWYSWKTDNGFATSYFITTCGYGYVDMGKLQSSEVSNMYAAFQNAPAIIFDLRNYPNGTLWDLAPLLFQAPIVSTIYYDPALTYMPSRNYMPGWYYINNDSSNFDNWSNPNPFSGNIYMLVNQETISQSEYTCQYLSYHPNSKVIGTQSAGADGDVSCLTLPGNIYTNFTSCGWYYADGYQQQRNGVKIDSIVSPTPEGLRHGLDEILEAVFNCPNGVNNPNIVKNEVSIYPNPVSSELNIDIKGNNDKYKFEIINSIGQTVFKGNLTEKTTIQTTNFSPGIYLIKLENGKTIEIKTIVKK
jgi:carboxyl-terminal processing protease